MIDIIHLKATPTTVVHMVGTDLYYEEIVDWESCSYLWEVIVRPLGVKTIPFLDTTHQFEQEG